MSSLLNTMVNKSKVRLIIQNFYESFLIFISSGSPYKFHVDSIASGHVTAYGPGLVHGISGEPSNFTISTKGAGAGGLSLAVEGPSKADVSWNVLFSHKNSKFSF